MKKQILMKAAIFFTLLLFITPALAWHLELENNDGDNTINVWFRVDEGESIDLTGYDMGFYYDATEVEFTSFTNNVPEGFDTAYSPEEKSTLSDGEIINMYGIGGYGERGSSILTEDYLLGTYTMTVIGDGVIDGKNDIYFPSSYNAPVYCKIRIGDYNTLKQFNYGKLVVEEKVYNGEGLDLGSGSAVDPGGIEGNVLENCSFESAAGSVPDGWHLASGSMVTIASSDEFTTYSGDTFAGNIGGTVTTDTETGEVADSPNTLQYGSLVQLVDLSETDVWEESSFFLFSICGQYLSTGINGNVTAEFQYLPASYNSDVITWDDEAWEGEDVVTGMSRSFSDTDSLWAEFETAPNSMPKARWVRVILSANDTSRDNEYTWGTYLGAFDRVGLVIASAGGELAFNGDFEESADGTTPDNWHQDTNDGALTLMNDTPFEGGVYLGKTAFGDDASGAVYQVIDLAENIPGWIAIDPDTGSEIAKNFIKYNLSAWVANYGGTAVRIGLEYLPYSYNDMDDISWSDEAWQARSWTSDGTSFTNEGGDAVSNGFPIEDTTVNTSWRQASYTGWLPRVRWIRLRIELDAASSGNGTPFVGIDMVELTASCEQYGPYSTHGNLPEATFGENPDAPDKGIPGWVGPEGDGICGGYTGMTELNYINPAFAGFADDYTNYDNSGQYIYQGYDEYPEALTGRPWNDAGWNQVIITLGDMDLEMQAEYFGPAASGAYHPGEITAVFNESPIVNGEGHDFATFENGFISGWTSPYIFAELSYVEVSSNGVDFIRMPTHSLTMEWPGAYGNISAQGVFGMTGKHVNAYGDSWGTPFDLEWIADHPLVLDGTVDLNNIRYVKQVDIPGGGPKDAQGSYTGLFEDSYGNPIFDAWVTWGSGGADLDGIGVLNSSGADSDGDHIVDYWDNCPQTANANQYDSDGDGYGNMCDCDINGEEGGDGVVGLPDYSVFRRAYGSHGPERIAGAPGEDDTYTDASENWNADADFNGDNTVGLPDYSIFRRRYGNSVPFE